MPSGWVERSAGGGAGARGKEWITIRVSLQIKSQTKQMQKKKEVRAFAGHNGRGCDEQFGWDKGVGLGEVVTKNPEDPCMPLRAHWQVNSTRTLADR